MDKLGNKNFLKSETAKIQWDRVIEVTMCIFYMAAWCFLLVWYWKGAKLEPERFTTFVLRVALPVMTVGMSFFYGISHTFGIYRWMMVLFFSIMYLLMQYFTFDLDRMLTFSRVILPEWKIMILPACCSVLGMLSGAIIRWILDHKHKKERDEAYGL
ncbi:MAG: hypothetical protein HUJ69_00590 [Lachnospiraceae bacterium]|nr:hypothetical protein [Lachnospiraceae bacterium]